MMLILWSQEESCSDSLYTLMRNCWRLNPDERPTFHQLHQQLKRLAAGARQSPQQACNTIGMSVNPAYVRNMLCACSKQSQITLASEAESDEETSL